MGPSELEAASPAAALSARLPGGQPPAQSSSEASAAATGAEGQAAAPGSHSPRLPEDAPKARSAWSAYSSIVNVDSFPAMSKVHALAAVAAETCEWVATEKVHGSNFCFETDGVNVEYASRTQKLAPGSNFFNAWTTMPRYHPFVLEAFRLMRQRCPGLQHLLIYGEYFGGWYPGQPASPGLKKVQGGVAYSPEHHFYAFDVSADGAGFLDFEEARELLLSAGFPLVAAPLWRGSLQEMLAIDVEAFETTLPAQLGHAPLGTHRIAEGIVIRPARQVLARGSQGDGRALVKKKAQAFWEATNQLSVLAAKSARATEHTTAAGGLIEVARGLVTENRLRAVISKNPELLQESQFAKLAGHFAEDVLEELRTFAPGEVGALGKEVATLKSALVLLTRLFADERMPAVRADLG